MFEASADGPRASVLWVAAQSIAGIDLRSVLTMVIFRVRVRRSVEGGSPVEHPCHRSAVAAATAAAFKLIY